MTRTHVSDLKSHLEALMGHVERKEDISADLAAIGKLQADLEGRVPFQLTHFLQNRSYEKALEFLASGAVVADPDRPDCDEQA